MVRLLMPKYTWAIEIVFKYLFEYEKEIVSIQRFDRFAARMSYTDLEIKSNSIDIKRQPFDSQQPLLSI